MYVIFQKLIIKLTKKNQFYIFTSCILLIINLQNNAFQILKIKIHFKTSTTISKFHNLLIMEELIMELININNALLK